MDPPVSSHIDGAVISADLKMFPPFFTDGATVAELRGRGRGEGGRGWNVRKLVTYTGKEDSK